MFLQLVAERGVQGGGWAGGGEGLTISRRRNGLQGLQNPPTNPFLLNGKVVGNWGAEVFPDLSFPFPTPLPLLSLLFPSPAPSPDVLMTWPVQRNLTYHLILRAGHSTPHDRPAVAFAYVRDFVLSEVGYGGA